MDTVRRVVAGVSLSFALCAWACGQGASNRPPAGYLTPADAPDMLRILPPAPKDGDARDRRDREIFTDTRKLAGTPRWAMAISDDKITIQALLKTFSCAMGISLDQQRAPKLFALLTKVVNDSNASVNRVKQIYQRKRPFQVQQGTICAPAYGLDYPSGHSALGFSIALVLTELEPDRATQLLERARAFGESRVVCGVHYASAVEAGRTHAAALVAALHGLSTFRADMDAARAELDGVKAHAPAPQDCAAEADLLIKRWYEAP